MSRLCFCTVAKCNHFMNPSPVTAFLVETFPVSHLTLFGRHAQLQISICSYFGAFGFLSDVLVTSR